MCGFKVAGLYLVNYDNLASTFKSRNITQTELASQQFSDETLGTVKTVAFSFHLLIHLYFYANVMLYYSSTVGVTVKTQSLVIRSILENHKSSQYSAELTIYNPSCTACGSLQHSTDVTGKTKNV